MYGCYLSASNRQTQRSAFSAIAELLFILLASAVAYIMHIINLHCSGFPQISSSQNHFYSHHGLCQLASPVKKYKILLKQSFAACMPLLMTTITFEKTLQLSSVVLPTLSLYFLRLYENRA